MSEIVSGTISERGEAVAGSYLIKRGDHYHFKRAVPAKLVSIIGKTWWRETLNTTDPAEAGRALLHHSGVTGRAIQAARDELLRQGGAASMLTPAEQAILKRNGGFAALRRDLPTKAREVRFAHAAADILRAATATPDATETGAEADDLAAELAEAEARVAALRGQLERNRTLVAKAGLKPSEALPFDAAPIPAPALDLPGLAERYAANIATKQHADQYRYPARLFAEFTGPMPLDKITKAQLRDWRDALGRLPRSTAKTFRSAPMRTAIARADTADVPRITPQTGAKHLDALKTLLKFAVAEGYLETNPADGLSYPVPKGKKSEQGRRNAFMPAQVRHLFETIAAVYPKDKDEHWVPLVALYQGMRQEEVCQLLASDIRYDSNSGGWTVTVTDAGEGRTVKNKGSVRTIPMHPALVTAGFLEHVKRAGTDRVFPSLLSDKRGRIGGPYGKAFARHLRSKARIVDSSLTFHSLRHTWRDAARVSEMPAGVAEQIGGWAARGNTSAEGYGNGYPIAVLARWLAKVDPFAGTEGTEAV